MKSSANKSDFLSTAVGVLAAAVTANLLWGSAAPCIKLGYRYFAIASEDVMSQILFAGVRFTLAGILTILLGSLLRGKILLPKPNSGRMIFMLAMMQTVIQYTFFYIGLSHAPSFKGSIISPTSTFFALLIAALVFHQEKLTVKKLLGCLIGFAGVVVVSLNGSFGGSVRLNGEGFLVMAAASYGCSSVLIRRRKTGRSIRQSLAVDGVYGFSFCSCLYAVVFAAAATSGFSHHGLLLSESGVWGASFSIAAG